MKILLLKLLFVVVFFCSFAPVCKPINYTEIQMEQFIREVYADQADLLVFKSKSDRFKLLTSFLQRVEVGEFREFSGKKFRLLSEIELLNKYNPSLQRDAAFDPKTFNPLKYKFPMLSRTKEVFRVDSTDYLIIIEAVK